MTTFWRGFVCAVACGVLAACSSIDIPTKKIDYKSAAKLPPLEVPPDLTRPSADDRFTVPDVGTRGGAATYSAYQREREGRDESVRNTSVLPAVEGARIERAGSQRWLVVKGDPDKLWPVVKDFWQETGFTVNIEMPEAGVMETDWAENRAKVPDGIIRNVLGRFLDSTISTSERDKFRTRLERGATPGTTEIYISHRGMEEVVESRGAAASGPGYTKWQPRPPDPELEAEMLRRLMVRFGVQEARAKEQVQVAAVQPRATLKRNEGRLTVDDQFDRAWRRVGLALDRVGFTVEDRDRSKGVYYVRYIDPDADNKDKGWFSRLKFWSHDETKKEQYRVVLKDAAGGTEVAVQNKDGAAENSSTANRILTLLYDQLK